MFVLETVVRIRREHASGKAIKVIARDLRLSRKVVRKAIRSPEAFNYQRTVQPLICLLLSRSEEHTSELQSLMRISYAVFCLKKKKNKQNTTCHTHPINNIPRSHTS